MTQTFTINSDDAGILRAAAKQMRSGSRQIEAFTPSETGQSVAAEQLKSIIERIERLEEDKKAIADDLKEVYGEAKSNGFNTGILRKIVALRKKAMADREEEAAILDLYMQALGMPA